MNEDVLSPYVSRALWICIGLFLLSYLVISAHIRLAADDFHFLVNVEKHGIWQGMLHEFRAYNSRWAAMILLHSVMAILLRFPWASAWIVGIGLLTFILSFSYLVNVLFQDSREWEAWAVGRKRMLILYFSGLIFYGSMNISETWFWITSSMIYLWGNIAWIIVLAWIFDKKKRALRTCLAMLSALLLGGSSEPLALFMMLGLILLIIHQWRKVSAGVFDKMRFRRSGLALLLISFSFVVVMMGEGTEKRSSAFESIDLIQGLFIHLKMTGIIFVKKLWPSMTVLVLGLIPVVPILRPLVVKMTDGLNLMRATGIFLSSIFLFQWPISFVTHDIGAGRTLFLLTFLSLGYLTFLLVKFSEKKFWPSRDMAYRALILFVNICLLTTYLTHQYTLSTDYAEAYDERMHLLANGCMAEEELELKPLPESGAIYSAEISVDKEHFSNEQLRNFFRLPCNIRLEAQEK